jgi:hypothetical protein
MIYNGQIFNARHISVMRISPQTSLKVVANTSIFFGGKWNIFLKPKLASLRYDKKKKLAFKSDLDVE